MKQILRITTLAFTAAALLTHTAAARPHPPPMPFSEDFLGCWRFDDPDWWQPPNPFPLVLENLSTIESWSGNGLEIRGPGPAILQYPCIDETGDPLLTCDTGTIRLWFAPDWTSGDPITTTADNFGRLIESGQWTKDASAGWWSLCFNPDHTALYLSAQSNGQGADFLKAPVAWRAGEWHLVTLTYSPQETVLYLDGKLAAVGDGVSLVPNDEALQKSGFTLGGAHDGGNLASGWFDDLTTFDRAQTGAEVVWYYKAVTTFAKITPVDRTPNAPPPVAVDFNPLFLSSAEAAAKAEMDEFRPQWRNDPMNNNSPSQTSNCLWLEITLTPTNMALLTLHGTTPGTNYLILSSTNLSTGNWVVETWMFDTNDQDWIEATVSLDRPAVFFRAGIGEDTDGDGLPDAYELLVTGTDPNNPDTGDTGTSDGYKDSDGDGWPNLDEMRNRTSPSKWEAPPAPQNFFATLRSSPAGTNVTLSWEPATGIVVEYEVLKTSGPGPGSTIHVASTNSTLVDSVPDDFDQKVLEFGGSPAYYQIRAVYPQGHSGWSPQASMLPAEAGFTGAIVRGPQGRIYLAVSAVPPAVHAVRLVTSYWPSPESQPMLYVQVIDTTNFSNGIYRFSDSESAIFGYENGYRVVGQAMLGTNELQLGFVCYPAPALRWPGRDDLPHTFIDGRAQLRENLAFLLRTATATQRFNYHSFIPMAPGGFPYYGRALITTDYEYAGFRAYDIWGDDHVRLYPFLPWQDNTMYRNFVLNDGDTLNGSWSTGATSDFERTIRAPRYLFNPWDYEGSPNPLPSLLSANSWQWSFYRRIVNADDAEIGVTQAQDGTVSLGSNVRNTFGLHFNSVKLGRSGSPANYPVLQAGGSLVNPNVNGLFPETAVPALQTVGYYFGRVDYDFFGNGIPEDPLPGRWDFTPTNATPLMLTAVGHPIVVSAWARQRITNGDANKPVFREEYFDQAYLLGTNGLPVHATGILSEYGEFFPTEPGRVILTTRPDPDQGGIQGTCLVHVISLSLDANHDGTMDRTFSGPDNTTASKPFRFWINNDNDGTYVDDSHPGDELDKPGMPDYADRLGEIRSARDLEDFARVWISGVPPREPGDGIETTLHWNVISGAPTLSLFTAAEPDGSDLYLRDLNAAKRQLDVPRPISAFDNHLRNIISVVPPGPPIPRGLHGGRNHFLFEGVGIGTGELVLTIKKNGRVLATASVFIKLLDVRDMYEEAHVANVSLKRPTEITFPDHLVSGFIVDRSPPQDATERRQLIVFVHGWRMSYSAYLSFSSTMFKRLWWQGFQGRFASLRWPTLSRDTDGPISQFFTYNRSEFIGFNSGKGASRYLTRLRRKYQSYSINVASHSMGGIVMAEALKDQLLSGFTSINNYVLMQAAVPAHCYQGNYPNFQDFMTAEANLPTPDTYRNYVSTIDQAIQGQASNFFNENDYALATGTELGKRVNWEANELDYKPDTGLGYFLNVGVPRHVIMIDDQVIQQRTVTAPEEMMAFVSRPRSKAVGAAAGVGGALQGVEVDLNTDFGFDRGRNSHSAQFNWNIQYLNGFYQRLLQEMQIIP